MRPARQTKQYIAKKFKTMAEGGPLVGDTEKAAMKEDMSEGVNQALGAQQSIIGRAQMAAQTGGPVMAQELARGTQQVSATAAGMQQKANVAATQAATELENNRQQQTVQQSMAEIQNRNSRRVQTAQAVGEGVKLMAGLLAQFGGNVSGGE